MGFFDTIANAFSRDGVVTTICEKIPVIGHVTAGVQALAGNPEHAKRALATSTGSLLTTAGAVGGFLVGGPPGAVIGGALASTAGVGTEHLISKTIDDPNVKGKVGDTSLERFVTDALLGGVSAMVGGGGTGAVGKELMKTLTKEGVKGVGKEMGMNAAKAVAVGVITGAGQALKYSSHRV